MKRINIILLLLLFTLLKANSLYSQENANEGKRFLVSFPLNDDKSRDRVSLGIYISSIYDTKVTLKNHFNNRVMSYNLTANSFIRLDNNELGNQTSLEDESSEKVSKKLVEITSDEPISVSIINSKRNSSESYLAYPVSEWGKNYIHNSFYHFNVSNLSRSSGFAIYSATNNTAVRIIFKGKGAQFGTTSTGFYRIGDTLDITLNANESYNIRTSSQTNNRFDLSGTLITSSKPIGVLSFHERTLLPQVGTDEGRDNLLEMQQPLSNWRKKFVSIDLGRGYGDLFRVLPIQDNTELKISNYSENGLLVSTETTILNTGEGFYEYNNTSLDGYNRDRLNGIKGNTIWEADAPILVSQYSYSQSWDKVSVIDFGDYYDPFMMNLINEDQFTENINFLVPPYNDFNSHKLNLVIKVDTTRDIPTQLRTIELDNRGLYLDYPSLLTNRIGESEYYWLRFNLSSGKTYNLNSNVRFGAFLYGFGNADSYGMQTALGNLPLVDTLIISKNKFDCNSFDVNYNIKSTFGLNTGGEFEGTDYKIDSFEVEGIVNALADFSLSNDSLEIKLTGEKIDYFEPSLIYLKVYSETGKVFYDTIHYQYFENIAINANTRKSTTPGTLLEFTIYIDQGKDVLQFLDNFEFTFYFKSKWFYLREIEIDDDSILDDLLTTTRNDTTIYSLKNKISRSNLINGKSVKIIMETMLSIDFLNLPSFILSGVYDQVCYKGTKVDTVEINVCAQGYRVVTEDLPNNIEVENSILSSNKSNSIALYNYSGSIIIKDIRINENQSFDLNSLDIPVGVYYLKSNNYPTTPILKYFHF